MQTNIPYLTADRVMSAEREIEKWNRNANQRKRAHERSGSMYRYVSNCSQMVLGRPRRQQFRTHDGSLNNE